MEEKIFIGPGLPGRLHVQAGLGVQRDTMDMAYGDEVRVGIRRASNGFIVRVARRDGEVANEWIAKSWKEAMKVLAAAMAESKMEG